jgi:hypothetical protein
MPALDGHKHQTALTSERVEFAYRGFVSGWPKSKIKKAIKEHFGLGWRASEDIITAAMQRRAKELIDDPERLRGELLCFFESVRESNDEMTKNQLRAAELTVKLLGLSAPAQHQVAVSVSLDDVVRDIERRRSGQTLDVPLPMSHLTTVRCLPDESHDREAEEHQWPTPLPKPAAPRPKRSIIDKMKANIIAKLAESVPPQKPKPAATEGPVSWDADLRDDF